MAENDEESLGTGLEKQIVKFESESYLSGFAS